MDTIVLTGGGTAGHVTPNLALVPALRQKGYDVHYIGTAAGMEKDLVAAVPGVVYHAVRSGKLRRYFSLKNLTDPFRVLAGYFDARKALRQIRPQAVFSKGGFVSVPVVMAARSLRIPTVVHESDYTPGLANRLSARYADKILVTFEETLSSVPAGKGLLTGTPIREELLHGDRAAGLKLLGFGGEKPVLLVMGGSQGAQALNQALHASLDALLPTFDIVHLCGVGKKNCDCGIDGRAGYVQLEYASHELPDIFACTSIVLARAGANSVFEFAALRLPALLVPLPLAQSRGDQILNARSMQKRGYAEVLEQEQLTPQSLQSALLELYAHRSRYIAAMQSSPPGGTQAVLDALYQTMGVN